MQNQVYTHCQEDVFPGILLHLFLGANQRWQDRCIGKLANRLIHKKRGGRKYSYPKKKWRAMVPIPSSLISCRL